VGGEGGEEREAGEEGEEGKDGERGVVSASEERGWTSVQYKTTCALSRAAAACLGGTLGT